MLDREHPNLDSEDPTIRDDEEDLMGLEEEEVADMQKDLFKQPPIDFIPRKKEPIDEMIDECI